MKGQTDTRATTCVLELLLHGFHAVSNQCNKLQARCEVLETKEREHAKRCREKETASWQQEAPTKEAGITLKPAPHKRKKTPPHECDVPPFAPWKTSDGPCHRCNHRWSQGNRTENFPMDPFSWKSLMNKMYVNWTWGDSRCAADENYVHIPTSLAQSLWSAELIGTEEMNNIDTLIRTKLFLPFLKDHDKPLFV